MFFTETRKSKSRHWQVWFTGKIKSCISHRAEVLVVTWQKVDRQERQKLCGAPLEKARSQPQEEELSQCNGIFKNPISGEMGRGNGPVGQMLAVQVWRPGFRSPALMVVYNHNPRLGRPGQVNLGPYMANLTERAITNIRERACFKIKMDNDRGWYSQTSLKQTHVPTQAIMPKHMHMPYKWIKKSMKESNPLRISCWPLIFSTLIYEWTHSKHKWVNMHIYACLYAYLLEWIFNIFSYNLYLVLVNINIY